MWPGPGILLSFVHLSDLKSNWSTAGVLTWWVQTSFCSVLGLVPLLPSLFCSGKPPGVRRAQRDPVLHSQELARTSGHCSDKNNRNLVRSQKICFLFIALVATKCDASVWGSFHFRFYIKQFSEERAYKYFFVPLALHLYVSWATRFQDTKNCLVSHLITED